MRIATTLTAILTIALLVAAADWRSANAQSKHSTDAVKYWISFVDKNNGLSKGPAAVESDYVSPRALARRTLRGLSPEGQTSSVQDVPVSEHYQRLLRERGVEPIVASRWLNAVSAWLTPAEVKMVTDLDFVESISTVAQSVDMSAEPQPVVIAEQSPDFPDSPDSYNLDYGASLTQLQSINAVSTVEEGFNGDGLLLGFLDTTTDTLHPALSHLYQSGRVVATRDFTVEAGLAPQGNRHGLNTSTTALGFDEGELIGACYGAEYIFATTEYAPFERNQEEDFFVAGMEWMERMGADIVNVSLGYSEFDNGQMSYSYEDMDGRTAKTTIAAEMAIDKGVVVVSSAGNEGCSNPSGCWYYITSPADGFRVITAGAVTANHVLVNFSGRGPTFDGRIKPDVAAQGAGVRYGSSSGGYGFGNGTSFSSPLVASVACQILQANPTLNPLDVRTVLRSTATQANNPDNEKGWGVVNAQAAVTLAQSAVTGTEDLPDSRESSGRFDVTVYPNPASEFAMIALDTPTAEQDVEVGLYDILGRQVGAAEAGESTNGILTLSVDLDGLAPGLYLVRARSGNLEQVKSLVVR